MTDENIEASFDVDKMITTNKLSEVHQEGNYLIATTELGTTFRQRIPANKILTKDKEDNWKLQDLVVG